MAVYDAQDVQTSSNLICMYYSSPFAEAPVKNTQQASSIIIPLHIVCCKQTQQTLHSLPKTGVGGTKSDDGSIMSYLTDTPIKPHSKRALNNIWVHRHVMTTGLGGVCRPSPTGTR